jgi:hypothetical protein
VVWAAAGSTPHAAIRTAIAAQITRMNALLGIGPVSMSTSSTPAGPGMLQEVAGLLHAALAAPKRKVRIARFTMIWSQPPDRLTPHRWTNFDCKKN